MSLAPIAPACDGPHPPGEPVPIAWHDYRGAYLCEGCYRSALAGEEEQATIAQAALAIGRQIRPRPRKPERST